MASKGSVFLWRGTSDSNEYWCPWLSVRGPSDVCINAVILSLFPRESESLLSAVNVGIRPILWKANKCVFLAPKPPVFPFIHNRFTAYLSSWGLWRINNLVDGREGLCPQSTKSSPKAESLCLWWENSLKCTVEDKVSPDMRHNHFLENSSEQTLPRPWFAQHVGNFYSYSTSFLLMFERVFKTMILNIPSNFSPVAISWGILSILLLWMETNDLYPPKKILAFFSQTHGHFHGTSN